MLYLWLKSLHIVSMVCWFAGLFYLPRLFIYHTESQDLISHQRFQVMERRLYYGIMTPSALFTIGLGSALLFLNPSFYLHAIWFHFKLLLILLLTGYHLYCGYLCKQLIRKNNNHSSKFLRWFNEFPVFILLGTVCLAVIKPF